MKVFLDTSSLFKLYYKEEDSSSIERIFIDNKVTELFLSELAKIEFASTVWKKLRKHDITQPQTKAIIEAFEHDYIKYSFVQIDNKVTDNAKRLISKYGAEGLRTLDSIQLSTAITLKGNVDLYVSSDQLLVSFLKLESLPT